MGGQIQQQRQVITYRVRQTVTDSRNLEKNKLQQSAKLGPLLFIIFINDLVDISTDNIKLYLFADDAKMYCHIRNTDDIVTTCWQPDLHVLTDDRPAS